MEQALALLAAGFLGMDAMVNILSTGATVLVLNLILSTYIVLYVLRIVMTWYPELPLDRLPFRWVVVPTEPLLVPLRRWLPPLGGIDISPVIGVGLFSLLREILVGQQGLLTGLGG